MKKILLVSLLVFFSAAISAQTQMLVRKHSAPISFQYHKLNAATTRATPTSEWYNYGNSLLQLLGQNYITNYKGFLFPDSTAIVLYDDGPAGASIHSIGQVFDPVDPNYNSNTVLSRYTAYTLDSVAIPYRYWRYQDSAPDTLVVQVYDNSKIDFAPISGFSNGASYATVGYDHLKRIGKNAIVTKKILLTNADTISTDAAIINIPVNLSVSGGGKVAATFTYLPGNSFAAGDTLDPELNAVNKLNAFEIFDYAADYVVPNYYNNELLVENSIRYNYNPNNWNSFYLPGTAFNEVYHLDIYFKITFDADVIGINSPDYFSAASIYPNPSSGLFYAELSSKERQSGVMTVYNVIGQEVMKKNVEVNSGKNKFELKFPENLSDGLYRVNLVTDKTLLNSSLIYRK